MTKLISYLVSAMMMLTALLGTPVLADESGDSSYLDSTECSTWTLENGKSYYITGQSTSGSQVFLIWRSINGKSTSVYSSQVFTDEETGKEIATLENSNNFLNPDKEDALDLTNTAQYILSVSGDDVEVGAFIRGEVHTVHDDNGVLLDRWYDVDAAMNIEDVFSLEVIDEPVPREIILQAGQSLGIEKNTEVSPDNRKERAGGFPEIIVTPLNSETHGYITYGDTEVDSSSRDQFDQMTYKIIGLLRQDAVAEVSCDSGSLLISIPHTNLPYYNLSGLFEDIPETMWYHDVVYETFKYGLMTGTDASHFEPNSQMTRAMVATVLYRMAGSPEVTGNSGFSDVPDGMYYSDPVTWAVQAGVVTGYTTGDKAGTFGPNDNVTREQLCTMAYRYLDKVAGKDTSEQADLDGFNDKDQVSGYAVDAVKYCVAKGVISGAENGTMLYPLNNATRAECAKILLNTSKVE